MLQQEQLSLKILKRWTARSCEHGAKRDLRIQGCAAIFEASLAAHRASSCSSSLIAHFDFINLLQRACRLKLNKHVDPGSLLHYHILVAGALLRNSHALDPIV